MPHVDPTLPRFGIDLIQAAAAFANIASTTFALQLTSIFDLVYSLTKWFISLSIANEL